MNFVITERLMWPDLKPAAPPFQHAGMPRLSYLERAPAIVALRSWPSLMAAPNGKIMGSYDHRNTCVTKP